MAEQRKFKMRDKNLLDSKRITLKTPCPVKGSKGWSSLHYYANNDNPGITVYTQAPGDEDNNYGRIQAKMGVMDMMVHLEQLAEVIRSKNPIKLQMICKSLRGKELREVDAAMVEVGKRQDGVVYIHVRDLEINGRPEIYFPFAPTKWHYLSKDGDKLTEAETSVLAARAIYNLMQKAITDISLDTYVHPKPKEGNGNYNNNRSNNNSGYSNNSSNSSNNSSHKDDDEDIPF